MVINNHNFKIEIRSFKVKRIDTISQVLPIFIIDNDNGNIYITSLIYHFYDASVLNSKA